MTIRFVNTRTWCAGGVLLISALSFFYLSVMHVDYFSTRLLNLDPRPDSTEYFAVATSIFTRGKASIQIAGESLPSRYPPGYSLLQVPFIATLGPDRQILAPFRVNQFLGFAILTGAFLFFYRRGKIVGGGIACLTTATLPSFATFARASTSEMTAAFLVVLCALLVFEGLSRERKNLIFLAAAVLGIGVGVRLQLIFFSPILIAAFIIKARTNFERVRNGIKYSAVFLFFASPVFIYNYKMFGAPLSTGYNFWIPSFGSFSKAFSPSHVQGNLLIFWTELMMRKTEYSVANLFGTGCHLTPAFLALAIIGAFQVRWNKSALTVLFGASVFFIFDLLYFYYDIRLYFPLLLLLIPLAVVPLEKFGDEVIHWKFSWQSFPVLALFLLNISGFPSQSGLERYTSQTARLLDLSILSGPSRDFNTANLICSQLSDSGDLVLSDISPVYLSAVCQKAGIFAPIDGRHDYQFSKEWSYGTMEAKELVQKSVEQDHVVFATFDGGSGGSEEVKRLPLLAGRSWKVVQQPDAEQLGVLKLSETN